MRWWVRVPLALVLLVLGVAIGTLSVAVHGLVVGLVLLVVASAATAYALPGGWSTRLPYGVGWLAVVLYASRPRPEGDYLVASDVHGYLLLAFGLALLVFCTVTMRRPPERTP